VLLARYSAPAHRAAALLGAGEDAEDVVQEAFVKAYRALSRFRPDAAFRPWLLQIVANETMNLHRSARRRSGLTLRLAGVSAPTPLSDDPEGEAVRAERRRVLLAAVRDLPEKDQQVLTCRYFLELSEAETATVLGWPAGSVKSRLSRSLVRLRAKLEQPLGEGVSGG
jgi:RNA polymerase sigma-70 factor (ECF subfamily)